MDEITTVSTCRVCGSDDWIDLLDLGEHPLANGFLQPASSFRERTYPMVVIVCRDCWLMSIRHVVDPAVLFADYVYVTSDSEQITQHMRGIVQRTVARYGLEQGDLVVELGSNIGTQLRHFADAGMRVAGVDPARNLAAIANAEQIPTLSAFFNADAAERVVAQHGHASLVLGRQCFAHIDDVHAVLDGATTAMAADGVVAIEVPYLLNLLDENQFDTIFHEHLSYYSFGTLTRLFAAHGLRMIDVERVPVHGGSIIVYATAEHATHVTQPSVGELAALERDRGLATERPYREFAARTRSAIDAIRTTVRDKVAGGAVVAGYGTPSKGCALLQFCGLGPDDLAYTTDTTEAKQGTVTPGTHIPVRPPDHALVEPPDYFLLLAWNYADEIIANEREFLQRGGRFIVPIPQPREVAADSIGRAA